MLTQNDLKQAFASFEDEVHPVTGFLPFQLPLKRLPEAWALWESTLDDAITSQVQLGAKFDISAEDISQSCSWRERVEKLPQLDTAPLLEDLATARRAHLVLAYIMHIYIHSLPTEADILIPPSIGVPLLRVSNHLQMPSDVTYSDTVLFNFALKDPSAPLSIHNMRSHTMFTNSVDEEEFYLASTRIELAGVPSLSLMRDVLVDLAGGPEHDVGMITSHLLTLTKLIGELKTLLLNVRADCRPEPYYANVRPWFSGEDSDLSGRKWVFDGLESYPDLEQPTELSGPSAGQSAMVHAIDSFLRIHNSSLSPVGQLNFQQRMRLYMPPRHRAFLDLVDNVPVPLRDFVLHSSDEGLHNAYNGAVTAMKEWRDAHMIIATMYIVSPARKAEKVRAARASAAFTEDPVLKGTGGTDLVRFLKSVRANTAAAVIT